MEYILFQDAGHQCIGGKKARPWFGRGNRLSATRGKPQCDTFVATADKRKCRPLESTRSLSENDARCKQTGYTPVASVKSMHANVLWRSVIAAVCHTSGIKQQKSGRPHTAHTPAVVSIFFMPFLFPPPTQNTQNYTNQSFNYRSMWLLVTVI